MKVKVKKLEPIVKMEAQHVIMRCHKSSLQREVCSDKRLPILYRKAQANNLTCKSRDEGKKDTKSLNFDKKRK